MAKRKKNSMEAIDAIPYKGHTISIYPDPNPENPREWSNIGRILYFRGSGRYKLGDEAATVEEMNEIQHDQKQFIALPVYTYMHGGTAMQTKPYGDPWDSGQSGVIYTWITKALKAFGRKKMTPALRKKVEEVLAQEVKTFGEYLNGEVYGYITTDSNGEEVDSLWSIMPYEYAIQAAKDTVDELTKK